MRLGRGVPAVRVWIAVACGVAGVVGCASVLGIDSDRHVDETTDSGTPPLDGSTTDTAMMDAAMEAETSNWPPGWTCLDNPVPATPDAGVKLELIFTDVSGATGNPIVGAEVHWCYQLDLSCMSPGPQGSVITNDSGIALLTVPPAFDGYYEFDASAFNLSILSRVPQYFSESHSLGMPNSATLAQAPTIAQVTQDPGLSLAVISAADCTSASAGGVVFDIGSPGTDEEVVYLLNDLPTKSAMQTDSVSGSALLFNVPAGSLTITESLAATHQVVRTVTTIARPNWTTFVQIRPDQATIPGIDGG